MTDADTRATAATSPDACPAVPERTAHPTVALVGLALASLLASLGTSIASIGLPTLGREFEAPTAAVQWVLVAYLLATTSAVVGIGAIGDRYGRRRTFLSGVALYGLATALCGASNTLGMLVAARAVQGLGAAAMTALAIGFVGDVVPRERSGSAMGLIATTAAVGTMLGLVLGGSLIAAFGWRALFFGLAPPAAATLALLYLTLPADRPARGGARFDVGGTATLATGLAAYVLGLGLGGGHAGALNLLLLATGAGALLLFVRLQRTSPAPLVDLSLFRIPVLRSGLVATTLVTTVVMALLVVGPYYLGRGLGLDPARIGLVMAAGPLVSALTGIPAGRLVDRFGTRGTIVCGLVAMTLGATALSMLPLRFGVPGYLLPLTLLTGGYAAFQAANNTAVIGSVGAERRGVVGGLMNLARNLGLITGAAMMGAVFAPDPTGLPAADSEVVVAGLHRTFEVAVGLLLVAIAASGRRE